MCRLGDRVEPRKDPCTCGLRLVLGGDRDEIERRELVARAGRFTDEAREAAVRVDRRGIRTKVLADGSELEPVVVRERA